MSTTIDEQFIDYIVRSLVGNPDAVKLTRTIDEKGVLLELTVDPEDLGRVIGKRGATAQSLRTLLRALGTKNEARYNLKIVDNGVPRPDRELRSEAASAGVVDQGGWASQPVSEPVSSASASNDLDDEDDHESVLSQTRKELEDLDDLDV